MRELPFNVDIIHESVNGGDHVVKYEAVLALSDEQGPVRAELMSLVPSDADDQQVQLAVESVERGARSALAGRSALSGRAAVVRLYNFVIHPIDFRAYKCEQYTSRVIEAVLREV
jgi:hypothetical protein